MVDQVRLEGLSELRRKLKRLPKQVQKRELNRALRRGGTPVLLLAKMLAPRGISFVRKLRGKQWVHTGGRLQDSIVMRAERKRFLRNTARQRIGVLQKRKADDPAFYWRFVEFGTAKQRAQPFLVPAFEAMKLNAAKTIRRELIRGVERQANKL